MKNIDIIIPQWNQGWRTVALFNSISALYTGPKLRIILIDNGSDENDYDSAIAAIPKFCDRLIIRNEKNLGFVRGVNQGLAASDGDLVVIQNNDTEMHPHLYERLTAAMEQKEIGAVGPVCSDTEHSWQGWKRLATRGVLKLPPGFVTMSESDRAKALLPNTRLFTEAKMVAFFCTMFRRDVLQKVGSLSEDFGVGLGDDDEFCYRIRKAGFKIAVHLGAYVTHTGRATFKAAFTDTQIHAMKTAALKKLKEKCGSDFGEH